LNTIRYPLSSKASPMPPAVSPPPAPARPNLVEVVYERLKQALSDFTMRPGDRFAESELTARFGISRTPLRVALYMLVREGYLVKVDGHSGWMVRPLDIQHFEDVYDVRVALELLAIGRLCRADPFPDLDALKQVWLVPAQDRLKDGKEVARLDEAFHSSIVAAAGNAEALRIHTDISERIRIIRRLDFLSDSRLDTTYEEHGKLLRAILARREADAAMLLRAHVESSKAEIRHITLHKLAQAQGVREPAASAGAR
jgi:DNA-binding GntR family transcriptional regulator